MGKIDVAAYIWPAYTGDEMRSRIFWEEGIGEWQTVKNAAPKENGYDWRRKPLWGYQTGMTGDRFWKTVWIRDSSVRKTTETCGFT